MILLRVIFLNFLSPNESFLVKPVTVSSTVEIIKALFILGYLNLKVSTDPLEPKIILCILVFNQFILYKIRSIQHVRTQITIHQIMLYLLNIYTRKKLSSPHLHYPTSYPPPHHKNQTQNHKNITHCNNLPTSKYIWKNKPNLPHNHLRVDL